MKHHKHGQVIYLITSKGSSILSHGSVFWVLWHMLKWYLYRDIVWCIQLQALHDSMMCQDQRPCWDGIISLRICTKIHTYESVIYNHSIGGGGGGGINYVITLFSGMWIVTKDSYSMVSRLRTSESRDSSKDVVTGWVLHFSENILPLLFF